MQLPMTSKLATETVIMSTATNLHWSGDDGKYGVQRQTYVDGTLITNPVFWQKGCNDGVLATSSLTLW